MATQMYVQHEHDELRAASIRAVLQVGGLTCLLDVEVEDAPNGGRLLELVLHSDDITLCIGVRSI